MVQFNFALNQVQARYGSEGGGFPPGKFKVIIEKSEVVPVKDDPNCAYLALHLKSIEGVTSGQVQIDRLNLFNTNPQTVQIAQQQLAAYAAVVGRSNASTSEELHNIPLMIEVRQQRKNPDYTEIAKIYDINGNEPGKGAPAPQQGQGGPPAGFQAPGGGFQAPQAPAQNGGTQWAAQTETQPTVGPVEAAPWANGPQVQQQTQPQTQVQTQPQQGWQPQQSGQPAPGWGPR